MRSYTERFIDNGYDDLETVKMIGEDDLKAMGIDNKKDKEIILLSVKILREHGGAWVYFLLGEEERTSSSRGKMSVSEDGGSSFSNSSMSPSQKDGRNYSMDCRERKGKS